jgi:hypothetical protein
MDLAFGRPDRQRIQGKNREFSGIRRFSAKICIENGCEFRYLRDVRR